MIDWANIVGITVLVIPIFLTFGLFVYFYYLDFMDEK